MRHMGPRPQPQRLCPLKFHKLALGAATLSRNGMELPHPKNWAGYASANNYPAKTFDSLCIYISREADISEFGHHT